MQYLGEDAKLYVSASVLTNTTYATPLSSATLLDIIVGATVSAQHDNPQMRIRSEAWVINGVSKTDGTISFEMKWIPSNAGFVIIKNAFWAKSEIAAFALDLPRATAGAQGQVGNYVVTQFNKNEPTGEFQTVSVELKPSGFNGNHTVSA